MSVEFAVTKMWILNIDLAASTRQVFEEDGEFVLESGGGNGSSADGAVVGRQ